VLLYQFGIYSNLLKMLKLFNGNKDVIVLKMCVVYIFCSFSHAKVSLNRFSHEVYTLKLKYSKRCIPLSNPPQAYYVSRSDLSTKLSTLTPPRHYENTKSKRSNNRYFTAVTWDMETFGWSINELYLNCEKKSNTLVLSFYYYKNGSII